MIIHSPIISGSLTFADGATVTYPAGGVYSGSFSGSFQGDGSSLTFGGTNIISSSAQLAADFLDTLGDGVVSGSSQISFNGITDKPSLISGSVQVDLEQTTNFTSFSSSIASTFAGLTSEFNEITNNPFSQSAASVTVSKSIIPTSTTIDLGSAAVPFRDLYLSSASLYVDGTQVISSNTNELVITTDVNQSLKLVETGADTIQIQTQNGDITLTSTGTGNIELDAPVQIVAGNKVLSSDGNAIVFGEDLDIEGNLTLSGTVDGVDIAQLNTNFGTLKGKTLVSGSSQISFAGITGKPTLVSGSSQIDLSGVSNSITTYVSEGTNLYYTDARVKTKLNADSVISGSSQVSYPDLSNIPVGIISESAQITPLLPSGVISGSSQVQAGSITGDIALGTQTSGNYVATLGTGTGVTIGSNTGEGSTPTIAVNYGSTANTAVQGNTSITFAGTSNEITIDGGSSITLGSGGTVTIGLADSITGNRTFSNDVTITGNLTVNGTTTTVNSNTVNIGDNILVLNSDEAGTPSQNGGIEIERGTSTNASLIWSEANDYWVAGLAGAEERIVIGAGNTSITTLGTITTGTWNGTAIADSYISSATAWNAKLDSAGTIATNDYAKFDASGDLTGRSYSEVKTDLSLNNVENTALSTWAGSSNITTLGTIATGTWNGSVIASAYLDADTAHLTGTQTFSGAKTFSSAVTISNSTASTSKTTGALKVTGGIGIGGDVFAGGDVVAYASSDERLKKNIEIISKPIDKVKQLKGVTWTWKDEASEAQKATPAIGVIAQDVEKVLPQLVDTRDNGFKAVDYGKMVGLLIEAIKDQQKQIDELKSRLG